MRHVTAFVTDIIRDSTLPAWLDRKARDHDAQIEWLNVNTDMERYKPAFQTCKNIITWQCRMPHSWTSTRGVNVLHVDNALINQKHGCFVDSRGFFSQSNLKVGKHWELDYPFNPAEVNHLGWPMFTGGDPKGPILVALQLRTDCNVNFEFPQAPRSADKVQFTINIAKQYLHDHSVLLRPHPRERHLFSETDALPPNWKWSLDDSLALVMPKCSSLVTVNSTSVTEACLLGLPVFTLGTGTFTGSGAVHECHDNFAKLHQIGTLEADHLAQKRYVAAVLGRHTLPYNASDDFENAEVDLWLARLQ